MYKTMMPLFVASPSITNQQTIFNRFDKSVTVTVPGKLMQQLANMCDGNTALGGIVELLSKEWDKVSLEALLEKLIHEGVLVENYKLSENIWSIVQNPSRFSTHVSNGDVEIMEDQTKTRHKIHSGETLYQPQSSYLNSLLSLRHSVRQFSGETTSLQTLVNILWSAYGEIQIEGSYGPTSRRTVPSAGSLYPLQITMALLKQTESLNNGVYRVEMPEPGSVGFVMSSDDSDKVIRAFLDPLMLEGAQGVIVISGSFGIPGRKYGNRSMLYVTLEAGHVAQNIHLTALEQNLATVEIGGFVDELLYDAVMLPDGYRPLTCIAFGHAGDSITKSTSETDWAIPMAGKFRPDFAIALARISADLNDDWSYGRDSSPKLASIKANAEAREWGACGCIPSDLIRAKLRDLPTAIDPRSVIKFHPAQYRSKEFPFEQFDDGTTYEWACGRDEVTGAKVHILADLVYFPYTPKSSQYAFANSSGVAAHPDKQKAIETSTLELVERDSFMLAYLARLALPRIAENTLPQGISTRIKALKEIGFDISIVDHSIDLAPVAFVFAQNEQLAFMTCASCASFDREHAISHALMEVEASVLARLQNGPAKLIKPHEVEMPLDHGALYEQNRYFRRADFMIQNRDSIHFMDLGMQAANSWQELLARFAVKDWRLLTVRLQLSEEYGGNQGLHIYRSIVPGMVPMTFGYNQVPGGMARIYEVAKKIEGREIRYGDLSKFPHPFA